MRDSKFIKVLCYITIPIFIVMIFLSIVYEIDKREYSYTSEDSNTYFSSDEFLNRYMNILSTETNTLIYQNANYTNVQDGENIIYYSDSNEYDYWIKIKDFYYAIVYKNKIFTNVELTTETNTLEKLKVYINEQNKDGKFANIINGNIESNSEIIATKAIQYFASFKNTYYTKDFSSISDTENDIVDSNEESSLAIIEEVAPVISSNGKYVYITTSIEDFQIFSSYKEAFVENVTHKDIFLESVVKNFSKYDSVVAKLIPVYTVLLFLIFLYLVLSIGYTKENKEVHLNIIDKIPLEFILIISIGSIALGIISISKMLYFNTDIDLYNLFLNLCIAIYLLMYIISICTFTTIIKRIKAKTIFKDSIIGKILKIFHNILKVILQNIGNAFKKINESWSMTWKLLATIIGYGIISIILLMVFNVFGIILGILLGLYLIYKIIEKINCYEKIEKHLKEMYEGNHPETLKNREFTPEFQNSINYINNISNGFENAIEERMKSERLKTELITNVSHDIKTPLTSIINYVDLLKKEDIKNEKVKEYIEVLENKSQRLKKLTEDLVEASKASSGNVKLDMQKIQLKELIKQSIGEFEDKFKEKELEIITNYPKEDVSIFADNRYLYRVIENIFSNVSKYALEKSRVYIDINKKEKNVIISVKNISKERLNISVEELMQRFVRGDKSRTTEGSGLGISISKSLTELQKGKFDIRVDGDLFKVELEFETI